MNALFDSARFPRELGGWAVRGAFCATVSFIWALVAGFDSPFEIAGMVAGVAAWVTLFAAYCAWQELAPRRGGELFVRALKVAAWIKFGASAAGGLLFLLMSAGPKDVMVDLGVVGVMPECMLGLASIFLVSGISGLPIEALETADSFGWTALITFVDGTLFLAVIGVLALVVLLWWRFAPALRAKLNLSPARLAG